MWDEKNGQFDESKFPEILDCARHDMIHHGAW